MASDLRVALASTRNGTSYVTKHVNRLRRALETAYVEATGQPVGVAAAVKIATACTALRQAARIDRVLAASGEPGTPGGLTHEQWVSYSDRLLRYRQAADKAIDDLGLAPARADVVPGPIIVFPPEAEADAAQNEVLGAEESV
jgi:hypothetical protein